MSALCASIVLSFNPTSYEAFRATYFSTIIWTNKSAGDATHCSSHRAANVKADFSAYNAANFSTHAAAISKPFGAAIYSTNFTA
jgi:hypothetical protein